MFDNLFYYKSGDRTFKNCIIVTVPGKDGFLWIDNLGQLHNAGMQIEVHNGDVQVLHDEDTGEMSYGWYNK